MKFSTVTCVFAALAMLGVVSWAMPSSDPEGSVLHDPATHVPRSSNGCGKSSPYKLGKSTTVTAKHDGVEWTYIVYVPKHYDSSTPLPLILQHPGWGLNAKSEEKGCGITSYADSYSFISVTVQGQGDNKHNGGPWYSWNAVGSTLSPGPGGPTCTEAASYPSYCYESCGSCSDNPQCWWTTCDACVTKSGTGGSSQVDGFVPSLYDTLEEQLCIDTTREFAAGESNGGMMTYQLGVDLASRLAAIAPQFGSFHRGFNMVPKVGVPVLDLHGSHDTTVPANVSLSADGYYYTPVHEIFHGNSYSKGWLDSNGCKLAPKHYPTRWDGQKKLYCISMGECSGGDVVRCSWDGGHNWLFDGAEANGGLVTEFLLRWTKPSHSGKGGSHGETVHRALLSNITTLEDTPGKEDMAMRRFINELPSTVLPTAKGHYGDPRKGCRSDEDTVAAGTGVVCAPKIGHSFEGVEEGLPPNPMCKIGGTVPIPNGCPVDADMGDVAKSKAFPVCLAKGVANTTDPYNQGSFHCLLVCPCALGPATGPECSAESHTHCPTGSRCERGELRNMAQGVCTYHSTQ